MISPLFFEIGKRLDVAFRVDVTVKRICFRLDVVQFVFIRVIHRQALNETDVRVREMEDDFKDFRSELDGLYKDTKELRIKLKSEKDRHKVEMEEMMTQFGETKGKCKLKGPTAVTLSLSSAAKKEPVIKDSSPSQNNRSRKRTRKKM